MGLSAGVIYVSEPDVGLSVAQALGLVQQDAIPLNGEEPGFPPAGVIRVATMHGWSIVMADTDAFLPILDELSARLSSISVGRKVFCWVSQSTAACLLFELHENGALQRKWSECEGELLEQYGTPLRQEDGLKIPDDDGFSGPGPTHDEWTMLALAQALVDLTEDEHFELTGEAYAFLCATEAKKPWWKVW